MNQSRIKFGWLLSVGMLAMGGLSSNVGANEIVWRHDYRAALEEAKEQERPLLVKVSARWCSYCVRMQSETLTNSAVVDEISENFVALELDADRDRELISRFNVSTYPTTIIMAPDRRILSRLVGYKSTSQFSTSLRGALGRYR